LYCEHNEEGDDPFSGENLDLRLVQLPETLVNLINLETLDLRGNALSEIPEFLADMPALSTLNLEGNPIRKIPDSVWRHLNGWERLGGEYLATFFDNRQEEEKKWLFGLPRDQLTEIPFALWFKENCTLPYIWLNIESWCRVFRDWHIIPSIFALVVTEFTGLLAVIPNTASFLINVFLLKVVEPIITQVRDAHGYDRHVAGR
jgi:hypothetical protein